MEFGKKNINIIYILTFISYLGNGIQNIVSSILVFNESKSFLLVGGLVISISIPRIIFAALAGVISDKYNRKVISIFSLTMSGIIALVLPMSLLYSNINKIIIFSVNILLSVMNVMYNYGSNAMYKDIIKKEYIVKFSARYQIVLQSGMIISVGLGGVLLEYIKAEYLLMFNSLTFFIAAIMFTRINYSNTLDSKNHSNEKIFLKKLFVNDNFLVGIDLSITYIFINMGNALIVPLVLEHKGGTTSLLGAVDAFAAIGVLLAGILFPHISKCYIISTKKEKVILFCAFLFALFPIVPLNMLLLVSLFQAFILGIFAIHTSSQILHKIDSKVIGRFNAVFYGTGMILTILITLSVSIVIEKLNFVLSYFAVGLIVICYRKIGTLLLERLKLQRQESVISESTEM